MRAIKSQSNKKKMSELLKLPLDDSAESRPRHFGQNILAVPARADSFVVAVPQPAWFFYFSFGLVPGHTGVLNLTLHLRRPPSVYFHPFHTVDEARRRRKRNSKRESSRQKVSAGPDRGWTEKRLEHEWSRESGRVTTLGVDEAVAYG